MQYDVQCSPEEFLRLMEILLGQYQVGAIPAVLDAVTVGESAALEHRQTKLLFLCGCTDGCFPKSAGGVSLLTEPERRRLRAAGVGLAPDENEQMDRNLLGSYALMCAAEDRLTLSAGDQSAWLFTTLCRLYPDAVAERSDAPSTAFATARTLGLHLAGGAQMDGAPREAEEYCRRLRAAAAYDFGPLSAESIRGMYGEKLFLSASRIDRHAACRFHFFLYDGLKARERKAASFDAPIYGTFVHDVLEKTVRRVMAEGGFHQTEKSRVREIAKTHMDEFLSNMVDPALLSSGRFSYLMNRNYDEVLRVVDVLCDELRDSAFAPADCELQFGYGGALPPVQVTTPEGQAVVAGAVDRVDVAEIGGQTYYRVVDYKTGGYKDEKMKADNIDQLFKDNNKDYVRQTLFYQLLCSLGGLEIPVAALYFTQKLGREFEPYVTFPDDGLTDTQRVADFRKRLADFVHHMRTSPFSPTANSQNCRYCPYTLLCGRTGQRRG